MTVYNIVNGGYALVTARDSATVLSLSINIMSLNQGYKIRLLPTLSSATKGTAITQFLSGKESVAKGDIIVMKNVIGAPANVGLSCNIQKT